MGDVSANDDDFKQVSRQYLISRRDFAKAGMALSATAIILRLTGTQTVFADTPQEKSTNNKKSRVTIPAAGNGLLAAECGPQSNGQIDCGTCGDSLVEHIVIPLLITQIDELVEKKLIKSALAQIEWSNTAQEARDTAISENCHHAGWSVNTQRSKIVQSCLLTMSDNALSDSDAYWLGQILLFGYPLPKPAGTGGGGSH